MLKMSSLILRSSSGPRSQKFLRISLAWASVLNLREETTLSEESRRKNISEKVA